MIARPTGTLLLLLALMLASGASAFYDASSDVVSLTAANFESKIKSGGVWLVEVSRQEGARACCKGGELSRRRSRHLRAC